MMMMIRRHNGQCPYGPWISADIAYEDGGLPGHVVLACEDEAVESMEDYGEICIGGQIYIWSHDAR